MSSVRWIRLSGLAAVLGGMLWIGLWAHRASMPVPPPGGSRPGGETFDIWTTVALSLFMLALTGAYVWQAKQMKLVGKAGFALSWIGFALMAAWILDIVDAYLIFLVGVLTVLTGFALFGIATLRAKVLSRTAAVPLIVGVLLFALVNPEDRRAFLAVPLGIGWVWLGYFLWPGIEESAA